MFTRRRDSQSIRSRMLAERERAGREMRARAPGGGAAEPPWWKEMLGIGTKREWILVVAGLLLFAVYTYENEGARQALWAFTTAVSGLLIGRWWTKRNEEASEATQEPVLGLGDTRGDDSGVPD